MLKITQLKLPVKHTESELKQKILQTLRIKEKQLISWEIAKKAIDAREKEQLKFVYTIYAVCRNEDKILSSGRYKNIMSTNKAIYQFPESGSKSIEGRPIVIGSGPAGLFCAYELAVHGYRPIVLERGKDVDHRKTVIEHFWETKELLPNCNVQFGEGGAGTFSDGKLNTGVKDKAGRNEEVLRLFVAFGAPERILYDAKPHLGTDLLIQIVKNIREEIKRLGGEVYFDAEVTALLLREQTVTGVRLTDGREFYSRAVILAIGHSARDTFAQLCRQKVSMEQKAFAVGVRMMHPQQMIDRALYGAPSEELDLEPSAYHLAANFDDGRGVYSFCMCPGGYVVNASSEQQMLAVNGMSYHGRASGVANSAIIATVKTEDYQSYEKTSEYPVLAGMAYQRELERKAFAIADGKLPLQTFEDFSLNSGQNQFSFAPMVKGTSAYADVSSIFSKEMKNSLVAGIRQFGKRIAGFDRPDAILSGVESRTSSPVRILRGQDYQSNIQGLYPCGEGAGYAGGITSAAMDGLKVAEAVAGLFALPNEA